MLETGIPEGYRADLYPGVGDLERYLLNVPLNKEELTDDNIFRYASLPEILIARGIEDFVNTVSNRTQADPWLFEHRGAVHLQKSPRRLLFPEETSGGSTIEVTEKGIAYSASVPLHFTDKVVPVSIVHGHPRNGAHSNVDLASILDDNGFVPFADLIGTPQFNYLILPTMDTREMNLAQVEERISEYRAHFAKTGDLYMQIATRAYRGNDQVADRLITSFDGDVRAYYSKLAAIQALSEEQLFGFYLSRKYGYYERLSQEKIRDITTDLLGRATT